MVKWEKMLKIWHIIASNSFEFLQFLGEFLKYSLWLKILDDIYGISFKFSFCDLMSIYGYYTSVKFLNFLRK